MQHLCEDAVFRCGSHTQALRQVFIPCAEVACDDKVIVDALGQHIGKVALAITLISEGVVEA